MKRWILAAVTLALCSMNAGCLSSAPIVPVTPANQAQISTCESTATLHNGVVVGGFSLSATGGTLGAVAALEPNVTTKNTLDVAAAVAAGLALVDTSLLALSSSNFSNNNCSSVVGNLPIAAPKPAGQ